ncbi:hypothetical protein QS257_06865 [Terrilactibacillus sp. S3-3]|nr:hypothetical protein QS257_06865 [Terrilactibacillus sp. S3-3]
MGKLKLYTIGATVGGIIGGTIVLLSTPKKGADLRKSIKQTAAAIKTPLKEVANNLGDVKNRVSSLKKDSIPVIKSTVTDIGGLVNSWKADIQPHLTKLKGNIVQLEAAKEKLKAKLKNDPSKSAGDDQAPPSL